jgi:hypothetical protein
VVEASTSAAKRSAFEPRPANNRARVSNGMRLLNGVDGRSAEARRFRDLIGSLAADLGDPAKLSEAVKALVRQTAAIVVVSERLHAKIVRDEAVDLEQATRVANAAQRGLARLAALRRPSKQQPVSVADILARRNPQDGPE